MTNGQLFFIFIAYVAAIVLSFIVGGKVSRMIQARRDSKKPRRRFIAPKFWGFLGGLGAMIVGLALVFFAVGPLIAGPPSEGRQATVKEVAEHFGMTPGEAYPFVLGAHTASTVSIGLESGGNSYNLDLPLKWVKFKISDTATPSVKLYLKDVNSGDDKDLAGQDLPPCANDEVLAGPLSGPLPFIGESCWNNNVRYTYSSVCESNVNIFVWGCVAPIIRTDYVFSKEVERRGLASVVQNHFDAAEITLTHDMYQQLLKTPKDK